jgi:hypothetical protein
MEKLSFSLAAKENSAREFRQISTDSHPNTCQPSLARKKQSTISFFSKIVSRRSLECASLHASKLAGAFAVNYS